MKPVACIITTAFLLVSTVHEYQANATINTWCDSLEVESHSVAQAYQSSFRVTRQGGEKFPSPLKVLKAINKVLKDISNVFEPTWGAYTESSAWETPPLALFRRSTFVVDTHLIKEQIRNPDSDFNKIYTQVHATAIASPPSWYTTKNSSVPVAAYAKCCAFVCMMDIDPEGKRLDETLRITLFNRAMTAIQLCKIGTPDSMFFTKGATPVTGGDDHDDVHQYRSKELINYCVAYEMIRLITYPLNIPDESLQAQRDGLKNYAIALYVTSNRISSSLSSAMNNNIVLMTASALAMAGIVCHNETDYWYAFNRHPNRWVNKAFCRINQSMFSSTYHKQSEPGDYFGYREGPGYYGLALQNLMPMFISFNNFVREEPHARTYIENAPNELPVILLKGLSLNSNERVQNFLHDPNWQRSFEWYASILQPNGACPIGSQAVRNDSFGFSLIRLLEKQLQAAVKMHDENGLTTEIAVQDV